MKKFLLLFVAVMMSASALSAFDTTAFQFSFWAPKLQLVPPEIAVSGLKLNLPYGNNGCVTGLDIGLVSINREQDNQLEANVSALQVNLFNSTNGTFAGIEIGLFNHAENASGIEIGLINNVNGTYRGIEIGLVNLSMDFRGLEIGLVNYTEFLTGLQIGIINIATKSSLPFFPIINMCF